MTKPVKTAQELNDLVAQLVNQIPELVDDLNNQPNLHVIPSPVYWHERDEEGCNWNIAGGRNIGPYTTAIVGIVGDLRRKFDIAE